MTRISKQTLLLAWALVAVPGALFAQTNGSNSPYSRYGFGLLSDRAVGFNKGMGGVAYGMRNGRELNPANPASYSSIDSLTFLFDIGMTFQNGNIDDGRARTNARNTSLDYVTAGFRLSPNLGMSLGLLPYSTIGYQMETSGYLGDGSATTTETYMGDGGLHKLYLGAGWKPFHPVSLGFNVGMLWGNMNHIVQAEVSTTDANSLRRQYDTDVLTYTADFGVQMDFPINKDNELVVGLTYGLGHGIKSNAHFYNQIINSGTILAGDSISTPDAFELPHTFGAGLSWKYKDRLRLAADYEFQKWGSVRSPQVVESDAAIDYRPRTGMYKDAHRIAVGADYVANPNGVRWRHHIRYRAGFEYKTSYTLVDGHEGPYTYTVSAGVGLPITNIYSNRSLLNLSVQYQRVKPRMAGMLTENYLRFNIGIAFNERWFMKWKVE